MRILWALAWGVTGCGATVPLATHRQAVAEQRTAYEGRLFEAERARLRCENEAARRRSVGAATEKSLQRRVQRLERAAAREPRRGRRRRNRSAGPLARTLRRVLGPVIETELHTATDGTSAWRVPGRTWFDAGSARLRGEGVRALERLANVMADYPAIKTSIRVTHSRVEAGPPLETWRFATERGVAVVSALHGHGVAPARLTLCIGGAAPDGRIVFEIRTDRRPRPGTGSLDSPGARRHSQR